MYPFVLRKCSTNSLGHGHGYECHSPVPGAAEALPEVGTIAAVVAEVRALDHGDAEPWRLFGCTCT